MGGTTSLVVAAQEEALAVVGLSPPAKFEDQDALAAVASVTEPKLLIATEGDAVSLMFEDCWPRRRSLWSRSCTQGQRTGLDILCQPSCPDEESAALAGCKPRSES